MIVKDAAIIGQVEAMGSHYRANIATQFVRPALFKLSIDKHTWDVMKVFTEKYEDRWHYGISLEELYEVILAATNFISVSRRELSRYLKQRIGSNNNDDMSVLRSIAANNILPNLDIFAEKLKNLYSAVIEFDKLQSKGKRPVYLTIPDLAETESIMANW